jgi:hypothetical protein
MGFDNLTQDRLVLTSMGFDNLTQDGRSIPITEQAIGPLGGTDHRPHDPHVRTIVPNTLQGYQRP